MRNIPKTYSKAAIIQSLAIDFNIDHKSIRRVTGASLSMISNYSAGRRVVPLEKRPERKRLKNYLAPRVKRAALTIRIFLLHGNLDIYLVTTDGLTPEDGEFKVLSSEYIRLQTRKDIGYKAKGCKWDEIDLVISPYHNKSVNEILKLTK